jgi:transposase, IS5 family
LPPIGLERVLRIYFLQQWYGLTDEALEDVLYDSQTLRGFAGIDLNRGPVPDATTVLVLHFRHWLERHELTKVLFDEVGAMLAQRGLVMRQGTIVDATIIVAPSTTKNSNKVRDPQFHQSGKGLNMVQPLGSAVLGHLVEFPQDGRQLQRLEVMSQKKFGGVGHAASLNIRHR